MRQGFSHRFALVAAFPLALGIACKSDGKKSMNTKALVETLADNLDAQTTPTGGYVRHQGATLEEKDAWGRPLEVAYAQGGVAEKLTVRSFGPDGVSHTEDDIVAERTKTNLRGIGAGLEKGIGKAASEAAKGVVAGTAEGVKGLIRREKGGATSPTQAIGTNP